MNLARRPLGQKSLTTLEEDFTLEEDLSAAPRSSDQ